MNEFNNIGRPNLSQHEKCAAKQIIAMRKKKEQDIQRNFGITRYQKMSKLSSKLSIVQYKRKRLERLLKRNTDPMIKNLKKARDSFHYMDQKTIRLVRSNRMDSSANMKERSFHAAQT